MLNFYYRLQYENRRSRREIELEKHVKRLLRRDDSEEESAVWWVMSPAPIKYVT